MSKSKITRKQAADAVQLRRISHPASHPYKEGPHVRGNGTSTQNALDDKDKIQRMNHPAEDQAEKMPVLRLAYSPTFGFGVRVHAKR